MGGVTLVTKVSHLFYDAQSLAISQVVLTAQILAIKGQRLTAFKSANHH
jgi:hypothetical protein